ncbi:MAG: hypothetical protein AMXMBFR84_04060 [Candidatus Hydrogenedentota bacterium]
MTTDESAKPSALLRGSTVATASATVFLSSACIMIVEMVAGRLVSRHIGQSLYTWTAIIGVVLAGMSVGNYLGGRMADRFAPRRLVPVLFLLAAAGCLATLPLNAWAGTWPFWVNVSWPVRIVGHIAAVFLLPALCLGTISPAVVRMALDQGLPQGRTVGEVYAWAVAGSILGTFLTGYGLLQVFGVTAIVAGSAAGLALVGIVYLVTARKTQPAMDTDPKHGIGLQDAVLPWRFREIAGPATVMFLANLCVMAMEIAAGRILAKDFGYFIYTWTAVIGVVLAGLTIGNFAAGRFADRRHPHGILMLLFIAGSVSCLTGPALNAWASGWLPMLPFPWPLRITTQMTVAFFLPSLFLGMTGPVVTRIALDKGREKGRTIGTMFASNAMGSIAGTFLGGFLLVPAIGMLPTIAVVGLVLAVLAVASAPRNVLGWGCVAVAAASVIVALVPGRAASVAGRAMHLRLAEDPAVVYRNESQYSYVAVLQNANQPSLRSLYLDKLMHSKVDLDNPLALKYEYEWIYRAVIDQYYPEGNPFNALVIGGGGYTFPRYLELTRPGSYVEVIEIDPVVTEASYAAFGLPRDTSMHIVHLDGRNRIEDLAQRKAAGESVPAFDCIFGDSINDVSVPYHLTTREFNERLKTLLKPDGIYLLNTIDMFDSGKFVSAVARTCQAVFDYVYVFSSGSPPNLRDTFVIVSSQRPLELETIPESIRSRHPYGGRLLNGELLDNLMARTRDFVLTDDFAPVDNLLAPVVLRSGEQREEAFIDRAIDALAASDPRTAEELARQALSINARSAKAYEILGVALSQQNDHEGAIAAYREAIAINPAEAIAHYNLGLEMEQQGDTETAIASWRNAVAADPAYEPALRKLGTTLLMQGRAPESVEVLQLLTSANPQSATAFYNLGLALGQTGQLEEAVKAWSQSAQLNPANADTHYNLALSYQQLGKPNDAWIAAQACIQNGGAIEPAILDQLRAAAGAQ